jgi:hypothetical protein
MRHLIFIPCFLIASFGLSGAQHSNTASDAEGKALFEKVIAAAGGRDRLNAIKSIRVEYRLTAKSGDIWEGEELDVPPDKVRTVLRGGNGETQMVIAPGGSFSVGSKGQVRPLNPAQIDDQLKGLQRSVWYVAQHAQEHGYVLRAQGTQKVGNIAARVLSIHAPDQHWLWFVDPATGYILREQTQVQGEAGLETEAVDYSEWRAVQAIAMPFHEETSAGGKRVATVTVTAYEINPAIDAEMFKKPEQATRHK